MRFSHLVSLLATTASLVSAQKMIPTSGSSSFPACAVNCPVLLQAQTVCTPPNAIQSTQMTYNNCFCQVPTLGDLYTTGETLCTAQCTTTADRQLLSTWFTTFCKQVGSGVDPVSGSNNGGGSRSTLTTITTTAGATATATSQSNSNDASSASNGPWIKTHWQWIIMLFVLFFGLLGIGLGARWFKKRHDKKMEQTRATMSGFPTTPEKRVDRERALSPEIWGPHQHMAASKGYQYNHDSNLPKINEDADNGTTSKDKTKRASKIEVTEVQPKSSNTPSS